MTEVRVKIFSGSYEGKTGIMDSCGWISFTDSTEKIHNSKVEWKFLDF